MGCESPVDLYAARVIPLRFQVRQLGCHRTHVRLGGRAAKLPGPIVYLWRDMDLALLGWVLRLVRLGGAGVAEAAQEPSTWSRDGFGERVAAGLSLAVAAAEEGAIGWEAGCDDRHAGLDDSPDGDVVQLCCAQVCCAMSAGGTEPLAPRGDRLTCEQGGPVIFGACIGDNVQESHDGRCDTAKALCQHT